jgi:hypothetical protein
MGKHLQHFGVTAPRYDGEPALTRSGLSIEPHPPSLVDEAEADECRFGDDDRIVSSLIQKLKSLVDVPPNVAAPQVGAPPEEILLPTF